MACLEVSGDSRCRCPLEGFHCIWLGSPGRLSIVDVDQIQRRQIMMQPLSYYHEEGWGGELRDLSPAFVLRGPGLLLDASELTCPLLAVAIQLLLSSRIPMKRY